MRRLVYMLPILLSLALFDCWLSDDRQIGWERNSVLNSMHRWAYDTRARVAIMGSSTSKDWLPAGHLERQLGLKRGGVIDAHINGCHQGCTWAEVRRMLQRYALKRCRFRGPNRCEPPARKRFDKVFFGTNLFQLCENTHSKRTLQHYMLTPTEDVPALFSIYLSAETPLLHIGRYGGMALSGTYGDTQALRDFWGARYFGKGGRSWRWYRATPPPPGEQLSCDYSPEHVALKRRFSEALLDSLGALSETTYLMLLPDKSVALDDPEQRRRWAAHLALQRALADARPWVEIVDLVDGGADRANLFRDGFHLNKRGMKRQLALFDRRLKALGMGMGKGKGKGKRRRRRP